MSGAEKSQSAKLSREPEVRTVTTSFGTNIKPVFGPEDLGDFSPEEELGNPGEFPYTRGIYPNMYRSEYWTRRNYAGMGGTWTLERLLATKALGGIVGLFLGLAVFVPNPTGMTFIIGVLLTGIGFFAVDVIMNARARERRNLIEQAFPNTIDQITISVEAGLGLDAAIAHAARTGTGPLAGELERILQDVQTGLPRQQALEAFAERTDVSDIRHFVVAVSQANRYGVPVSDALRVQALEGRERRQARAEERAQKMSVKLLFPLIFCILPSLFVVLLGPAAIRIANLSFGG